MTTSQIEKMSQLPLEELRRLGAGQRSHRAGAAPLAARAIASPTPLSFGQERLWLVGRQLHAEGSDELAAWVEPLEELLYQGKVATLLERLRGISFRGPGSKGKRKTQKKAIAYLFS